MVVIERKRGQNNMPVACCGLGMRRYAEGPQVRSKMFRHQRSTLHVLQSHMTCVCGISPGATTANDASVMKVKEMVLSVVFTVG